MQPRKFALIGGITLLVFGLIALIPALSSVPPDSPLLSVNTSYGVFLGIFPMNIFNKLALIVLGALGIVAANAPTTSLPKSIWFARLLFVTTGSLAILGMIDKSNTLNGTWPLFGNEIWGHGLLAVLGAYFGFALSSKAARQPMVRDAHPPVFRKSA